MVNINMKIPATFDEVEEFSTHGAKKCRYTHTTTKWNEKDDNISGAEVGGSRERILKTTITYPVESQVESGEGKMYANLTTTSQRGKPSGERILELRKDLQRSQEKLDN